MPSLGVRRMAMPSALRQHLTVVAALVIREMCTRYGTKFGGYAWAIIDPLAFVVLLSVIFSAIARTPALGTNFPLFFATGYMAFWIYRSMADQVAGAVKSNRNLLNYPVVNPYDTVYARAILQILTQFLVCMIIFTGIGLVIEPLPRLDMYPILEATVLALMLGMGVGMVNVVAFHMSPTYQQVFNIVNRPLYLLSGVFLIPDHVPEPYRTYLFYNPLIHIVAKFRQGFYGTYRAQFIDMPYVVTFACTIFLAGFLAMKIFDSSIREQQ